MSSYEEGGGGAPLISPPPNIWTVLVFFLGTIGTFLIFKGVRDSMLTSQQFDPCMPIISLEPSGDSNHELCMVITEHPHLRHCKILIGTT